MTDVINKVGIWTTKNPIDEFNRRSYSFLRAYAGIYFQVAKSLGAGIEFAQPRLCGSKPAWGSDIQHFQDLGYEFSTIDLNAEYKYRTLLVGCASELNEGNFTKVVDYVNYLIRERSESYVYFESDGVFLSKSSCYADIGRDLHYILWLKDQPDDSIYRKKLKAIVTPIPHQEYLQRLSEEFGVPCLYLPFLEVGGYQWTDQIRKKSSRQFDYYMLNWFNKWQGIILAAKDEVPLTRIRADVSIYGKRSYEKKYKDITFTLKKNNYRHQELTDLLSDVVCYHGVTHHAGRVTSKIFEAARAGSLVSLGYEVPIETPQHPWELIPKELFIREYSDPSASLAQVFKFIQSLSDEEFEYHVNNLRKFVQLVHLPSSNIEKFDQLVELIDG